MRWWSDASYAVHEDMKCHTRATLSLGKGEIYSVSWKQRLVAWSSTESELIGVYDVLPQILWTEQFLEVQGWLDSATVVLFIKTTPAQFCWKGTVGVQV